MSGPRKAGNVTILNSKNGPIITIGGTSRRPPSGGNPMPNTGTRPPQGQRYVRNQFNITGSTIGSMAIGNKGTTILNQKNQTFQQGSKNVDFNIKGGNFNQANLAGTASYHNDKSSVSSHGGASGGATSSSYQRGSIERDIESDMVAEKLLIEILKMNVSMEDLKKLLLKKITIERICQALKTQRTDAQRQRMIQSMLNS